MFKSSTAMLSFSRRALLCAWLLPAIAPAAESTCLTIYSSARPGGVPAEWYRPVPASMGGNPSVGITLPGYAVVKQERELVMPAGRGEVRFTDVAALLDPTTVSVQSLTDPQNTRVLDQNYQYDLVSADKLLERFIDKPITVEQAVGDTLTSSTGSLLSTQGGLVLKTDDGLRVVSGYSNLRFPELPGGLITRPTLVWLIDAAKAGPHACRGSYQTTGITWWADYNLVFAEAADANSGTLDVGAWVSILNQSGGSYAEAKLKLVAGDVHRAPPPSPVLARMEASKLGRAVGGGEEGFAEKAFFEYHLYTLGRAVTLPHNSTKQIELFPAARGVPCEKVLVYDGLGAGYYGYGQPMTERTYGATGNTKIDVYLRFKNDESVGLGVPLPAGRIRVSKLDPADQSLEFIGEDVIDHTARRERVQIKLGTAFDVVGERKQTDFRIDTTRKTMQETIEIELRNQKDQPVKVVVNEHLYRWVNWEIRQNSHDFTKTDARTIEFPVQIPAAGKAQIRYTVRYSW